MSINITTTHTITCENAPVEDVLKELQEKCPDADFNTYAGKVVKLNLKVAELTRERDEVQQRLEESWAVKEKIMAENANLEAANEVILASGSRPALPEGMRLAEHPEYGRVVVSPGTDSNGDYKVFAIDERIPSKANYWYAKQSKLTFLDSETEPAPLPKPEDCKEDEVYLAKSAFYEVEETVVAIRKDPEDTSPWQISNEEHDWVTDGQVTLLARLLPDRETKEQA